MNILITSVGNKVNLVKYFRRALHNEGGGEVWVADSSERNTGRFFADRFEVSPCTESPEYELWLEELIERQQINLIIPTRDDELEYFASVKKKLKGEHGCWVHVSDTEVVRRCLDKSEFYRWCEENGFLYPPLLKQGEVDTGDFPLFVKPSRGAGGRGSIRIENESQWSEINVGLTESMLIQRWIDAPEFSVDVFIDQWGEVKTIVPRERVLTAHGESVHGKVFLDQKIVGTVKKMVKKLGVTGHVTVQCFLYDGEVLFVEVNARFGGGFSLGVEAGADSPRFIIQERLGKEIKADQTGLTDGLEMVRVQKDIFWGGKQKPRVYCFDLDGTLCTESCPYERARPIASAIAKVNALHDAGHTIVISTARGAASGTCWRALTEAQLKSWGVRYHHLHTGKPYADYYVDNKSVHVLELI